MCLLRSFPNCREAVVDISMTPKDLWNCSMIDSRWYDTAQKGYESWKKCYSIHFSNKAHLLRNFFYHMAKNSILREFDVKSRVAVWQSYINGIRHYFVLIWIVSFKINSFLKFFSNRISIPIPAMTYIFIHCKILFLFSSLCGCLGCNHVLICSQKVQSIMYE